MCTMGHLVSYYATHQVSVGLDKEEVRAQGFDRQGPQS